MPPDLVSERLLTSLDIAPALGVDCFAGNLDTAAATVVERALSGDGGYACLGNVHSLVSGVHDPALRRALDGAWAVFPDGSPIAWLQRREGARGATRVAGPDLMARVFDVGQADGLRHYLYGSTAPVLENMTRRLSNSYPDATICGTAFDVDARGMAFEIDAPEAAISVETIKSAEPHIIWCGLGVPKQELWMRYHAPNLAPALVVGVGAAFDFIAGNKSRAPRAMQRLGLEWLYRLATEPRRLSGRYLRTNSEFLALLGWELSRYRGGA